MRRSAKRRLPIPQWEFGFTPDTFSLIQDTGLDGERLTRERAELEKARALAEQSQTHLFTSKDSTHE